MLPQKRKHKLSSSISCLLIGLAGVLSVSAQQTSPSNADWQLWPEVDVSIKLSQRVSVLGINRWAIFILSASRTKATLHYCAKPVKASAACWPLASS